jgi:AraC family transcriptional regulator
MRSAVNLSYILLLLLIAGCPSKKHIVHTREAGGRGELRQEPKIVELDEMTVVGLQSLSTHSQNLVPSLWERFVPRGEEIKDVVDPDVWLGVSFDIVHKDDDTEFFHIVGRKVSSVKDIPEGMSYRRIPAHKYAVFTHKGTLDRLGETYRYIYNIWLPESEHEYDYSHELEWYDERFKMNAEDSELDIYVPIK